MTENQTFELFSFYDKLTNEERGLLSGGVREVRFGKGSFLEANATQCHGLLAVKDGQLRVYINSPDGKEITLFRLLPGDVCVLSASCVIHNLNFDVQLEFESDSIVMQLRSDILEELKSKNHAVENYILELVSASFSEVMWVMEKVVFSSMTARLCEYLIERSALEGSDVLNITPADIAKDLGSAREVVSRLLKYLQNDGAITQTRGRVEILDTRLLMKYGDGGE